MATILSPEPATRGKTGIVELVAPGRSSVLPVDNGIPERKAPTESDPPPPGDQAVAPPVLDDQDPLSELAAERDTLAARLTVESAELARRGEEVAALAAERGALAHELDAERERAARLEQSLAERDAQAAMAMRELERTYDELLAALGEEIAEKDVALRRAREGVALSIVDRVLFPSGQADLTTEGRGVIDKVARVLAKAGARRLVIEGHTDDVPIGAALRARFPTNWELSTARATEVVRALVENGLPPLALEAVGRADMRPVASNETEAGRRQNRRIEIILSGSNGPAHSADPGA